MIKEIRVINNEIEKQIIIGMIVSTSFLKKIINIFKFEYLVIDYSKIVSRWIIDYWELHKKAPNKDIQAIYNIEKENLREAEQEIISTFLLILSDQYDQDNFNSEYLFQKVQEYFEFREVKILVQKADGLLKQGKIKQVKNLLSLKENKLEVTQRFSPFDIAEIRGFDFDRTEDRLLRLDGAVGRLIGHLERSWLVAVTAPEKRGKSWFLDEIIFSALESNLKVFSISLEMSKNLRLARFYNRITGLPLDKSEKEIIYPVFDCRKNQEDNCRRKKRMNNIEYHNDISFDYLAKTDYLECAACRGGKYFDPVITYKYVKFIEEINNKLVEQRVDKLVKLFGNNLVVRVFPRFSIGAKDIRYELDELEMEGFIPDVIIEDYVDIRGKEKDVFSDRGDVNEKWMSAARIAGERNCLYITADQSNRASRGKKSIDQIDTSEDKRKDAHLDVRVAINQTWEEKEAMSYRLSILFHRHNKFNKKNEVFCLQHLGLGRPLLDSEFIARKK